MPGMRRALVAGAREKVEPIKKMVGPLAPKRYQLDQGLSAQQAIVIAIFAFFLGLLVATYGSPALQVLNNLDLRRLKATVMRASM